MENDSIVLGKFVRSVQYLLKCGSLGFEDEEPIIKCSRGTLDELAKTFPETYLDVLCFASETLRKPLYVAKDLCLNILYVGERYNAKKGAFEKILVQCSTATHKEGYIIIESIYFGGDSAVAERVKGWGLVNSLTHSLLKRDFKGL